MHPEMKSWRASGCSVVYLDSQTCARVQPAGTFSWWRRGASAVPAHKVTQACRRLVNFFLCCPTCGYLRCAPIFWRGKLTAACRTLTTPQKMLSSSRPNPDNETWHAIRCRGNFLMTTSLSSLCGMLFGQRSMVFSSQQCSSLGCELISPYLTSSVPTSLASLCPHACSTQVGLRSSGIWTSFGKVMSDALRLEVLQMHWQSSKNKERFHKAVATPHHNCHRCLRGIARPCECTKRSLWPEVGEPTCASCS